MKKEIAVLIFDTLLLSGIEDYSPIYTIYWELNSRIDFIPEELRKEGLKKALVTFLRNDLLRICKDLHPEKNEQPIYLDTNAAIEIINLEKDDYFEPTLRYEDNLCVMTTPKGEKVYTEKDYSPYVEL